jgi:hypothetical protein
MDACLRALAALAVLLVVGLIAVVVDAAFFRLSPRGKLAAVCIGLAIVCTHIVLLELGVVSWP